MTVVLLALTLALTAASIAAAPKLKYVKVKTRQRR